jgi:hypothetical protein
MARDTAVCIEYWIATDHPATFDDLEGIDEFREELSQEYVSLVRGRPSGAGGAVFIILHFISQLPWSHVAQIILEGAAYDIIKEGARSFILRPFLAAYKKLKLRNVKKAINLNELKIDFQDCQIVIHEVSDDTIGDNLEIILRSLAEHYAWLALDGGEFPIEIHVPVVEDPDEHRDRRFRVVAHVDESITGKGPGDYILYWGLTYDRASTTKVYDVPSKTILHEPFNTVEQYWNDLSRRESARRKSKPGRE